MYCHGCGCYSDFNMAARVAVLAIALLVQAVSGAPHPQCPCSCGNNAASNAYSYSSAGDSGVSCGGDYGVTYGDNVSYGGSNDAYYQASADVSATSNCASSSGRPVGSPQVVSTSYGPSRSYVTAPSCTSSSYQVPVSSYTTSIAGPVSESSSVNEGCCSSSCEATRAKCSGTTRKVTAGSPTIINRQSSTSSSVAVIDSPKVSKSTKAGQPQISNSAYPASSGSCSSAGASSYSAGQCGCFNPAPQPTCSCSY